MLEGARNFLTDIGENRNEVPIYLLGTQGMRNMEAIDRAAGRNGANMFSAQVLNHVHEVMGQELGRSFRLGGAPGSNAHDRSARIITGKQEGVLAWVAVNYGFENREPNKRTPENTIGIFEIGGASMQIAFDTKASNTGRVEVCLPSGHHYIHAAFKNNYGADSMRKRLMPDRDEAGRTVIPHDCVRPGDTIKAGDVSYKGTDSSIAKWPKYVFSYNFFD
jgi:GDA1/CD39 (nucleoside phosphatase) family